MLYCVDIVELFLAFLMFIYLYMAFVDFFIRIILFQKLNIGGLFSALIPILTDYKLGKSYLIILQQKGLDKECHQALPVLMALGDFIPALNLIMIIWTAWLTCRITGSSKLNTLFWILFPCFRSAMIAPEAEEVTGHQVPEL